MSNWVLVIFLFTASGGEKTLAIDAEDKRTCQEMAALMFGWQAEQQMNDRFEFLCLDRTPRISRAYNPGSGE